MNLGLDSLDKWATLLGVGTAGTTLFFTLAALRETVAAARRSTEVEKKARDALLDAEQVLNISLAGEVPTARANVQIVELGDRVASDIETPKEDGVDKGVPGLALPALWDVTHKRLDYYHQIATSQARQSFRNAQIAMGIGFFLLIGFAVLALTAKTTTASIVTGALGAAAAGFAGYISRTFVRSQETAAGHLRSYFNQPLEFSRYLAAERLLEGLDKISDEQRAEIARDVIRGLATPPPEKGLPEGSEGPGGQSKLSGA